MGILDRVLQPRASYSDIDDFWYNPIGYSESSSSGVVVTEDRAQQISAVYAAVWLLAETLSQIPLKVFRRLDRGKEVASQHPLYYVLHDRPNPIQTSLEWREMSMGHLALRGNCYSRIIPGARGAIDQLRPLNPDRMTATLLPTFRVGYSYRETDGRTSAYTQDEIFHIRGHSFDGVTGVSPMTYQRQSHGLTLALEMFGATLFKKGALHRGVFKHPGQLSPEAHGRLKTSLADDGGLAGNAHGSMILEEGMAWDKISMSSEDAQFLLSRQFQISEIARWFHVPPHMIGDLEKATFSNIEQQALEFVVFTMTPWFVRWEQRINADLILAPQTYFVEFVMDGLVRGDMAARYAAYRSAIDGGWLTRNGAREKENLNPLPGLDQPLVQQNMASVDENGKVVPHNQPPQPRQPAPAGLNGNAAHYRKLVDANIARVMRKEGLAVSKALSRFADNQTKLQKWATEFYRDHGSYLAESLQIEEKKANAFADSQRCRLLASAKDGCLNELVAELDQGGPKLLSDFLEAHKHEQNTEGLELIDPDTLGDFTGKAARDNGSHPA